MNWLQMVTLQFNQPKFQLSKMLRIIANEGLEVGDADFSWEQQQQQ
jgi:hypothetical protein